MQLNRATHLLSLVVLLFLVVGHVQSADKKQQLTTTTTTDNNARPFGFHFDGSEYDVWELTQNIGGSVGSLFSSIVSTLSKNVLHHTTGANTKHHDVILPAPQIVNLQQPTPSAAEQSTTTTTTSSSQSAAPQTQSQAKPALVEQKEIFSDIQNILDELDKIQKSISPQ